MHNQERRSDLWETFLVPTAAETSFMDAQFPDWPQGEPRADAAHIPICTESARRTEGGKFESHQRPR